MRDTFAQNILAFQGKFDKEKQYWLGKLAGELMLSSFPPDEPRVGEYFAVREQLDFTFPATVTPKLLKLSKGSELALYLILVTGVTSLLHKYTGNEDVIIGSPVFKQKVEGQYVNHMVALRNAVNGEKSFKDLLLEVKATVSEASENANFPLNGLIQLLGLEEDAHRSALFDTIVLLQNLQESRLVEGEKAESIFSFEIVEGSIILGNVSYYPALFHRTTMEQIVRHLIRYFEIVTDHLTLPLASISLFTAEEEKRLLVEFNATVQEYPTTGKTLHQLFEEAVERTPEKVAVVYEEEQLTYRELNKRANQLALILRHVGVQRESIVGILAEPSLEMIIGIYAVLKAGGAYLPIGPAYPKERIEFTLTDSGAVVLLTQSHLLAIAEFEGTIIDLTVWMENRRKGCIVNETYQKGIKEANPTSCNTKYADTDHESICNLEPLSTSRDLAYIIYTSGSTGKPKGVMIEHASAVNTLTALQEAYPLMEEDAYLLKTAYTFDVSVTELFGWFFGNGRLVILPKDVEKDPLALLDVIAKAQITHLNFVPSMFNAIVHLLDADWLRRLHRLRYIFVAGEAIARDLVRQFQSFGSQIRLENIYGPTETAIYATWYSLARLQGGVNVPIGQPLPNVQAYILDQHHAPQPTGVAGELCIAGAGLARGYLNRPDLTAEKFIPCPFLPGERMYRTGDLARWLPDGNIEYLGRIDHQVKIRGYRIELGEIENQLLRHPGIQEAVVIDRADGNGSRYLCAYLVAKNDADSGLEQTAAGLTIADLRTHLLQQLPEYMIPAYFVQMEEFPLTVSGKIDRKALPEPDDSIQTGVEYVAPEGTVETTLAQLWSQLLQIEVGRISALDNFFTLGGHSLVATQLVAHILQAFHTEITLKMIFERPTLRAQAEWIAGAQKQEYTVIQKVEDREYYPATSAQKRIYLVTQIAPESVVYNMPAVLEIKSHLDPFRLRSALQGLVQRHESLRTSFGWVDDQLVQRIADGIEVSVEEIQVGEEELSTVIRRFIRPFDLSQAPLMRVGVAETVEGRVFLLFDMHHIVLDGVSIGVLVHDFLSLYGGETLPELSIQYRDFAVWQDEFFASETVKVQAMYWRDQFAGEIPVLNLPTDYPRPKIQSVEGERYRFALDAEATKALIGLAQEMGATPFMTVLAAYAILLSKYSGQSDIIIGSPVAGRRHPELAHLIGMFVNTLALRMYPEGKKTFGAFLQEVKETALNAMEHQDYPFENLLETLDLPRDLSRNPLFDVMFSWQDGNVGRGGVHHLEFEPYTIANPTAKFDLTLNALESEERITFEWEYAVKLFTQETVEQLARHLVAILRQGVKNPGITLSAIDILSEEEKHVLLEEFNATEVLYPAGQTVPELVEELALAHPQRVAVSLYGQEMTYGELNARAERLACTLRQVGLQSEEMVAIMAYRSFAMIIGILGIWKAGGAYVPMDPTYPEDRLEYMLRDSSARYLVTQPALGGEVRGLLDRAELTTRIICIEDVDVVVQSAVGSGDSEQGAVVQSVVDSRDSEQDAMHSAVDSKASEQDAMQSVIDQMHSEHGEALSPVSIQDPTKLAKPCPEHLAYMIYTSGTTGHPKGVMVEHRNIVNTVRWRRDEYQFTADDRALQLFSFSFDGFLTSVFAPLVSGTEIVLLDDDEAKNPIAIGHWLRERKVTHFFTVPSLYAAILECVDAADVESLRMVTLGGENLPQSLVMASREKLPHVEIFNEYGPTENAVTSTWARHMERRDAITIGKPIANTQIFIVDAHLQPVPIGVPGQICTAGAGTARGYWKRPDLTDEKFVTNPFLSNLKDTATSDPNAGPSAGHRLYLTGDLGKWLPNGEIQYLGRMDDQVKIRGFRIELGEITAQLQNHPDVKDAVVIDLRDDAGEAYLCAYVVLERQITTEELRVALSVVLPDYMIPAHFIPLESIPRTAVGKVDKRSLPVPTGAGESNYVAPTHPVEVKLAQIFADVLGRGPVGTHDHFFHLGGHSLKATQVIARVFKEFSVELPLRVIFTRPTVEQLAAYIVSAQKDTFAAIHPVAKRPYYPVTSAQKRLLVLDALGGENTTYNIPIAFQMEASLDVERLQQAIRGVIQRHEILRTCFEFVEDQPVQRVAHDVTWTLQEVDLRPELERDAEQAGDARIGEKAVIAKAIESFIRPFDLRQAPLFRFGLYRLPAQYLFVIDIHHIIADGASMGILMQDFLMLYAGGELSELRIQYKDYAVWQQDYLQSEILQQEEAFWLRTFDGEIPILDLPTDEPRPAVRNMSGDHVNLALGEELLAKAHQLMEEEEVTLFMFLLAVYNLFLMRYTGQEEIIVGSPVAGRNHADLQQVMGMFVNTLAFRNTPSGTMTFRDFLRQVKENALQGYEHQNYPFDLLVEQLQLVRDPSRNPIFDTMLVLQNTAATEMLFKSHGDGQMNPADQIAMNLGIKPYGVTANVSKFDLTLNVTEWERGLILDWEYCTALFQRESIERMARHWARLMEGVLMNPDQWMANVPMLLDEERTQLVDTFNATATELPMDRTLVQLFAQQAEATPEAAALIFADKVMTYRELNERSDELACVLRFRGVKREEIVGVMTERSFEMIIAIFGIWKAGGAFLPIDPAYPVDRIRFMLEDSGVRVLLTQSHVLSMQESSLDGDVAIREEADQPNETVTASVVRCEIWAHFHGEVLYLDDEKLYTSYKAVSDGIAIHCSSLENLDQSEDVLGNTRALELGGTCQRDNTLGNAEHSSFDRGNVEHSSFDRDNADVTCQDHLAEVLNQGQSECHDLAYVIYTSGTTGKPKGVMVEHRNIANTITWRRKEYGLHVEDAVLQLFSFSFDGFLTSAMTPLLSGAALVLLSEADAKDPVAIKEAIVANGVSHFIVVPSLYAALLECMNRDEATCLRMVTLAGEAVQLPLIQRSREILPHVEIINEYGPTENSVATTIERHLESASRVTIGRPVANTHVYMVDRWMNLLPVGVPGEMCIAGAGLARGYLHQPEMTSARFVSNPFAANYPRMYRTGDLARWLPDGRIEFVGRTDHQVKVRGFRIEMGEIEARLLAHPAVQTATIVARDDAQGQKYLCAYYVAGGVVTGAELKEHLSATLPAYMVPSYCIGLDEMPLTPNGKIDHRTLPAPTITAERNTYVAPVTEMELLLAATWSEVLGIDTVGVTDHFFEIGGDSIKAIQVSARLHRHQLRLEVKDLLQYPTIRQVAHQVKRLDRMTEQGLVTGDVPLTPIQHWFFSEHPVDLHHFNQALMLWSQDGFDATLIRQVMAKLVEHHDALRMVYAWKGVDGNGDADGKEANVHQYIRGIEDEPFAFEVFDLAADPNYKERVKSLANQLQRKCDLSRGPLVRLGLFKTPDGDHLLIIIHHLVVDGVSWRILLEDLATGYQQALRGEEIRLPAKTDSFQTWATSLQTYANKDILYEVPYWQQLIAQPIPALPKDREAVTNRLQSSQYKTLTLPREETGRLLKQVNQAFRTEINDILLTALASAMQQWAGVERIAVTLEAHGREEILPNIDISRTVGWFTATYPVVLDVSGTETLAQRIKTVKEELRHIPNRGIGYGILRYLTDKGQTSGLAFEFKPEIAFNYLGQFDQDLQSHSDLFSVSPLSSGDAVSLERDREVTLDITGIVRNGQLVLTFGYNAEEYATATMDALLRAYQENLQAIIQYCTEQTQTDCTPSDYGDAKLSIAELEQIQSQIRSVDTGLVIDQIYPLSPKQEAMMNYTLNHPGSYVYFEQMTLTLRGELDVTQMKMSFDRLVARHDVLRTIFIKAGLNRPRQVVLRERGIEFSYADWRKLSVDEHVSRLAEFQRNDRDRGFDLVRGSLMRIALLQTGEEEYRMVWSLHHILMDGWCFGIMVHEVMTMYRGMKLGVPVELGAVHPFSDYIQWLEKRDQAVAELYWQDYLAGYTQLATVPAEGVTVGAVPGSNATHVLLLDEEESAGLMNIARQKHVTLNTVLQTIWGILLQRYNGVNDVIFGTVVSGRPSEIPGVERIIGLFTNTLPVRIHSEDGCTFIQLLEMVQRSALAAQQYDYYPTAAIQSLSELKDNLFDHMFVFQNFPMAESTGGDDTGFEVVVPDVQMFGFNKHDFTLMIVPGHRIRIELKHNNQVYTEKRIWEIADHWRKAVQAVLGNSTIEVREIQRIIS